MKARELITDIQRFAVNDGPGFRTNVYLKGCPLRCAWCHNPETITSYPEIYWKRRLCVQCGACLEACGEDAVNPPVPPEVSQQEGSTYHKIIRGKCTLCMKCVDACHYGALEIVGTPMGVEKILDVVEKDRPFYANSGGGLTLSGGEPTMHMEFSEMLLAGAHERLIHTCLDTNGFCSWEVLERLIENADIVLFDVKHLDPIRHAQFTGAGNELILANLAKLARTETEIWVRIPVVPGFNDDLAFHREAGRFLSELPGKIARLDLIPYHNWCEDKYGWLGIDWEFGRIEAMEPSLLEIHAELYRERGIRTTVGGSGFEFVGTRAAEM